ncbi:TPA: DNA adenine methylase [Escherichia coli]
MSTILKWAGNKTAIMPELKKHLPVGPRLVEPFAGSCAVMMETDYPSYLVTDHQRQQLVYELKSRGFDGSEKEVDLLLRGGSIPSGAGLRIFYRNQRLKEDDKWRNLY